MLYFWNTFLKDIFMIKEASPLSIGLSQFKAPSTPVEETKKDISIKNQNIKLSDLMRRH